MSSQKMNTAAERLASQGIGSVFLYTHEAHPGENYPHLTSMEQKYKHAKALRDVYGVSRPILLDSLDGACHRRYGGYPNMTWIFNSVGTVMYKADWTDTASVMQTVEYLIDIQIRRKNRERLTGFRVERIEFRTQDSEAFNAGLRLNGQKAVEEFKTAFE